MCSSGGAALPWHLSRPALALYRSPARAAEVLSATPPRVLALARAAPQVICHYLATGRRVLVTSKGEPATEVLRQKLPMGVREVRTATAARPGHRRAFPPSQRYG